MRMFDGQNTRLSIDADFSIKDGFTDAGNSVFKEMEHCFSYRFALLGFELIDFRANRRPKKSRKEFPYWWGGWACEFKLVDQKYGKRTLETKRRNALIPAGSNSPKIFIDLSEHEYCGKIRSKIVQGTKIRAYSREILVLEKLRAICQQHPDYQYRRHTKNRARDFYDIHTLTTDINDEFIHRCQYHLAKVFAAKDVPLCILEKLWKDESFVDSFRRGFDQVRDTVNIQPYDFDIYLEHIRFLVQDIYPDIHALLNQ